MNITSSFKIQNVRSLNLNSNIDITRKKNNALTHESDDVIFIINAQIGQHKLDTYFNSNSSRAAGVGIAIKLTSDIQVLDSERDTDDRILILKTMIENELITLVSFYDTNDNKDSHLKGIETLLRKIDSSQGIIIGSDWNNFTDRIRDQRGNQAKPHYRTKATLVHMDWKTDNKFLDIYRLNHPEGKDLTYLKDEVNRKRTDKGSRLD